MSADPTAPRTTAAEEAELLGVLRAMPHRSLYDGVPVLQRILLHRDARERVLVAALRDSHKDYVDTLYEQHADPMVEHRRENPACPDCALLAGQPVALDEEVEAPLWCDVHQAEVSPDRYHEDRCTKSRRSGECRFRPTQAPAQDEVARLRETNERTY